MMKIEELWETGLIMTSLSNRKNINNMSKKLKETLVKIHETIGQALSILNEIPDNNSHNGLVEDVADVLCLIKETYIPEALAEPLRNCDVGTAGEQIERFNEYCCGKCDGNYCKHGLYIEDGISSRCAISWSQWPYESEVKNE